MTDTTTAARPSAPASAAEALERLEPILERLRSSASRREREHELPTGVVRELADAGFGALRVPREYGGAGLSFVELGEVLVELAAADSNLPQIFRGHFAFVEDRLTSPASAERDAWLERFAAGEIVGNAWSETGSVGLGDSETHIRRTPDGPRVDGRKFYTTGSLYADWIDATAKDADGTDATVLLRVDQPGVSVRDDWDGFGQQLTGTGTAVFDDAAASPADVFRFSDRFRYQTALYQWVLVNVLAGIAQATEREAGEALRARTRVYSHGLAPLAKDDGQLQAVIGEISAVAFTARALVRSVGEALDAAAATTSRRGSVEDDEANVRAEIASAQAQIVLSQSVPLAATRLFDTLGASAVSRAAGLDRHWRNARTVASHNPWVYKARIVGDWSVNGTVPPYIWQIGTAS
ncbi:acyl-CoA dehydrogenase family protein [Leifsonia sp. 1010]|uniref:acyl-CoA dehydrogenase family protein n=1 Tax=Leifsonia sp. 1010 TaxID=2817769 RepID=UPI00285B16B9|nr:acyl-CoA dehydrogenase family protein [Leifsonia sp. 1010]MDR6613294.1 alkylation response protein AidB-like acyl-CoA dehydrogenase [Leifsonia sp. 1010]